MNDIQVIDEELRVFILYCNELPALYDRKEQAAYDYYNTVGSPAIKSAMEAKYKRSTQPPIDRTIDLLQQKDELDAEYRWKAGFCRMMQKKLMRLSEEDIELLYWRYERRKTLRQLGDFYYCSKDALNSRICDVLRKMQA